jgi:hypothetical protein
MIILLAHLVFKLLYATGILQLDHRCFAVTADLMLMQLGCRYYNQIASLTQLSVWI